MNNRDPEKNFEVLWETFNKRYPFFELRKVDWKKQYQIYRPKVTAKTSDDDLFDIFCRMLDPLDDGHVEVAAKANKHRKKRHFTPEKKPRFHWEFAEREIKRLFKTTEKTLASNGFGEDRSLDAPLLQVPKIRLHSDPRVGRCQQAKIDRRS
jgi:carboxyl-terminal processing protease